MPDDLQLAREAWLHENAGADFPDDDIIIAWWKARAWQPPMLEPGVAFVRIAQPLVDLLESGPAEPVVLMAAARQPDGTYELQLRAVARGESSALRALVALLSDESVRAAATPQHLELARAAGWEAHHA